MNGYSSSILSWTVHGNLNSVIIACTKMAVHVGVRDNQGTLV